MQLSRTNGRGLDLFQQPNQGPLPERSGRFHRVSATVRSRRGRNEVQTPDISLVLMYPITSSREHTHEILVTLAERPHPFPSRTRKLSSPAPKILRGQPLGKIGRRRGLLRCLANTEAERSCPGLGAPVGPCGFHAMPWCAQRAPDAVLRRIIGLCSLILRASNSRSQVVAMADLRIPRRVLRRIYPRPSHRWTRCPLRAHRVNRSLRRCLTDPRKVHRRAPRPLRPLR